MENNIEKFRHEINIASYAEAMGWQVNAKKSDKNCTVVQREENGQAVETILVRRDEQKGYRYYTDGDPSDRGTIIDFLVKKENYAIGQKEDWAKVFARLNDYLGQPNKKAEILPLKNPPSEVVYQKQVDSFRLRMQPLTDTRYLESRGLTAQSFDSPEFRGQLFNSTLQGWKNTSFPLRTDEAFVCAINRSDEKNGYRQEQWNRLTNDRAGALHISNLDISPKNAPFDKLIIAESPIDTLSYFELHYQESRAKQEKNVYVATAGTPAIAAYSTLQKVINQTQAKQIIMAFDNDNGGYRHSLNVIGQISHPQSTNSELVKSDFACVHKKEGVLRLHVILGDNNQATALKEMEEKLLLPLEKKIYKGSEDKIVFQKLSESDKQIQVEIRFPYHKNYLIEAEKGLVAMKGLEQIIALEHPKQKDYNVEVCRQKPFVICQDVKNKDGKDIEIAINRFARPLEVVNFAESIATKTKGTQIYLEKYTAYQEYEAPELVAKITKNQCQFCNEVFKNEVEKQKQALVAQQFLNDQKIVAMNLATRIFPTNETILTATQTRADNSLECKFQTLNQQPLHILADFDTSLATKIQENPTHKFSIVFKDENVLLTIPDLKSSALIEDKMFAESKESVQKMPDSDKDLWLKNDLDLGELKLSDTQGKVLVIADYSVEIVQNGELKIQRNEQFDLATIQQDGLDSQSLQATVAEQISSQEKQEIRLDDSFSGSL